MKLPARIVNCIIYHNGKPGVEQRQQMDGSMVRWLG